MPAPWATGAQLRIHGKIHGQTTINVLHFATNTAEIDVQPPSPLLVALLAAVVDCVIQALLPAVTQDWTFEFCDARFVYHTGPGLMQTDPLIQTAPANSVGTLGPTSVSFSSSLINLRTGVAGKRGRGKIFLPPPGESNVTNSAIDASTQTALTAFLTCMAGKFLGTGATEQWRWGVFSRKNGGNNFATWDAGFYMITTLSPVTNLAVIGRRKIGHGK